MQKIIHIFVLAAALLRAAYPIYGQTPERYLVSEEEWLPNRTINSIFQDAEGLLWVGTGSGLYRYDGFQVKHFATHPKKTNTLFTNRVTDLGQDAQGNLLVSMESGLSLFNSKTETFSTLSRNIENFEQLRLTARGNAWIKAGRSRLYRLSYNAAATESNVSLQSGVKNYPDFAKTVGEIRDYSGWGKRDLLIGASLGLFRFDPVAQKLHSLRFDHPVTVLKVLQSGRLLIGTQNDGLFEVKIEKDSVSVVRQFRFGSHEIPGSDQITSLSEGPHGKILVSTLRAYYLAHDGSSPLDFRTPGNAAELLKDNNVRATYIDRTGVMWIGTLRGLLKIRPAALLSERIRIETPGYLPVNQRINTLFKENENRFWLKTKDDGAFLFDPVVEKFTRLALPETVSCFDKSEKGYMLAYGANRVFRVDATLPQPRLTEVMTSSQDIWCGLEISPGEWWFGCVRGGLLAYSDSGEMLYGNLLDRVNQQFDRVSTIYVMMRDSEQNVWIGSRGDGLLRISLRTGETKKYSGMKRAGSISRRILHLKEDSQGRIWVATREGGLYLYDAERDSFRQFTTAHGLPSNVVCAIGEDEAQHIIVSTDNGLAVYQESNPVAFQAYDQHDGIEFTDFSFRSVAETKDGVVYFGNSNGLYQVKLVGMPESGSARPDDTRPGFHWSSFRVVRNERSRQQLADRNNYLLEYDAQSGILLNSDENSFELTFSLLDFTDPSKNAYAYRLKGHRDEWKYILDGEPRVYFHDLPPGSYELEVRTADNHGRWSETIHSLKIAVSPPFWLSLPAYLLYALLLMALGFLTYRLFHRMNRLKARLAEEVQIVALQDQQMIYFSDLSHEIKNRLSMILGPLEKALSGKKVNQAVLNNLYEQTLRLKRISDQIMNLRKNEAGEFLLEVSEGSVFEVLERLCQETEPLAIVRDIRLHYTFGAEPKNTWFDEEVIEIILLNLLNNAIKYTPSGGTVRVTGEVLTLDKSDLPAEAPDAGQYLKCTVNDTGIGIPAAEVRNLFDRFYRASNAKQQSRRVGAGIGLDMVARLISKHRGFIDINSQEGDGTQVELYLPVEKKHFNLNEVKLSGQSVPILEKKSIAPPESPIESNTSKAKVLLVDDDPDLLEYLDESLDPYFETRLASDGEEAWNILLNQPIDLIISDLSMPGMNGLELLQHLKRNEELKHIPFIILTGRNSEAQKLICLQNGVDDFIDKPFSLNLIIWRARNLIDSRRLLRSQFGRTITVEPSLENEKSANELFIEQVVSLIEENMKNKLLSVEFLAEQCAMSRATFYRKMESLLDQPPSVFIRTYRLKKAAKMLQSGNYYVAEVAYQTGFSNPKYFSKCFQKEFGSTPTEYIKTLADAHSN
ncbi:hybrid sensor histidine kinase/response regulator transcription factor [Persicitalea jodogahamensis]|uniref:histidine kinase n=1 Tax=Persicitalea jodogahamensis TaxID=402147 RepID=A0A8J3DEW1_9BACT|nr:two-component regulator propeller domain-containing protein [Persicitalea jodogahamensis]GHB84874.1 sensor histidine kinase [Persicitalea jodogahamensis]